MLIAFKRFFVFIALMLPLDASAQQDSNSQNFNVASKEFADALHDADQLKLVADKWLHGDRLSKEEQLYFHDVLFNIFYEKQEYHQSLSHLRAIEALLDALNPDVQAKIALIYFQLENYDRALEEVNRAFETTAPLPKLAIDVKLRSLVKLDREGEARQLYEQHRAFLNDKTATHLPPQAAQLDPATSNPAMPMVRIEPTYPKQAKLDGVEGYVIVTFYVETDGSISDITVEQESPNRVFTRAVRRAIQKWQYMPAKENGVAVRSKVRERFDFYLN